MKKQQHQRAAGSRKQGRLADLAPKSRRALGVKAGAFNAFAIQQETSTAVKENPTKWIEVLSFPNR